MQLFYRKSGKGKPLIILHGLYGSSDNWVTIGNILSSGFEVLLVDLRNHGHSPHSNEHNYQVMSEDLIEFVNHHQINDFSLLGHSMGGKVAMYFANKYHQLLSHLIVADIAPVTYDYSDKSLNGDIDHQAIIDSLLKFDLKNVKSRNEADEILSITIKSKEIRMFLLKNLQRKDNLQNIDDEVFSWRFNLKSLYHNLQNIFNGFNTFNKENFLVPTPTLFIKGLNSNYINKSNEERIQSLFPNYSLFVIPGAGHFLHIEQPDKFVKCVTNFITK